MSAAKTLMTTTDRPPRSSATKNVASSSRRKASPHGASAFYTSRFARQNYAKEVEIRCEKASTEIREAIAAYRERLLGSNSANSNRRLVGDILLPAFGPVLEGFDADWKQREGNGQPLVREIGHVRIDVRLTRPTQDVFKDCLRAKEFRPEKIGWLYHLLGFRVDHVTGSTLDDDIEAIRSTLRFICTRERERLKRSLKRSKTYRFDREIRPYGKFCALCEELTELHSQLRVRSVRDIALELDELRRHSSRYCADHVLNGPRYQDAAMQTETAYRRIVEAILDEARRCVEFRRRFVVLESSACEGPTQAAGYRMSRQNQSAAEFAYVANVRHIARRIADRDVAGAIAQAIDRFVQQGVPKTTIMQALGVSKHCFTRNCDLAIARLRHQGKTTSEICRVLDISPQSLSQKQMAGGCFDFSPGRNPLLIWWPYGGLHEPNVFYLSKPRSTWQKKSASDYEGKDSTGRTIYRHTSPPDPLAVMLF